MKGTRIMDQSTFIIYLQRCVLDELAGEWKRMHSWYWPVVKA